MPHYPKRSQYKYTKKPYRVRNWREYETALRKRGELTLWFCDDAIEAWHAQVGVIPGGQRIYSDLAIETALTVRTVYQLGLRQTEGFLRSVSALLSLSIRIPDHSTLSRRSKQLDTIRACSIAPDAPVHLLIDSTGLKVHSGSEPRDKRCNRRGWRKLHLAVDAESGEILSSELTTHQTHDSSQVSVLLNQVSNELASVIADGAYDSGRVYAAIEERRDATATKIIIPPRRNPCRNRRSINVTRARDHTVQLRRELGIRRWRKESGYTRRSLVETAMSRFKMIIGPHLRSRTMPCQRTEARIACSILNTMTQLGMPDSYCAA